MDLKLLHLMEDFVLKEVDYSQQYGYSGRAKRYMRRKLTNQLSSFLENIESETETECDTETNSDSDSDSDKDVNHNNDNTNDENDHDDHDDSFDKRIHRDYKTIHNRIDLCFLVTYLMFLGSLYSSIAYLIFSYKEVVQLPQCLNSNMTHDSKSCL
jgi:hypothetical protein